jgi:F-type H+-transporting ATPase subunit gamma
MERLSEIQARIKTLRELADVVGAMRSLAAVRVQQAHAALPAILKYTAVVAAALADAFALGTRAAEPSSAAGTATGSVAIVFSSEQGFVGAFNEHVLERAATELPEPGDRLLVVGARGAALAAERRLAVAWTVPMVTHGGGVVGVARGFAKEVYRRADLRQLRRVTLVHARSSGGAASEVVVSTLLPFDPTPYLAAGAEAGPPPVINLPPRELIDRLVDELLLAELMRAAMESFASENGARLSTMEAAHTNIDKKLEDLSQDERRRRQDEITTELLDIVTGAEAVAGEPQERPPIRIGAPPDPTTGVESRGSSSSKGGCS